MIEWTTRKVDWKGDSDFLRNLFNTTWKNHPITKVPYFNWHLIDNPHGPALFVLYQKRAMILLQVFI